MELRTFQIPKSRKVFTVAGLGDIQWTGKDGITANDQISRFVDYCCDKLDAYFIGLGDYIDPMSPSNRRKLLGAGLYDTAMEVLWNKCLDLNHELFEKHLKHTKGRWIALGEGHHFNEYGGRTSDQELCKLLGGDDLFIGTTGVVYVPNADVGLFHIHGNGGGVLPGAGLNKLYHLSSGYPGMEIYLMGHNCKNAATRLSKPYPNFRRSQFAKPNSNPAFQSKRIKLEHRDVFLVNCAGFSKSAVVGHRVAGIPRGNYAEQANLPPSACNSAVVQVNLGLEHDHPFRIRVSI